MKKLAKLSGVKRLNKAEQMHIYGSGPTLVKCQIGCNGRTSGGCYGAPNCQCPGACDGGGNCNIY